MKKSIKIWLGACISNLLITILIFAIGETYLTGTHWVNIYCTAGFVSFGLFLICFGVAEILIREKNAIQRQRQPTIPCRCPHCNQALTVNKQPNG